MRKRAHYPTDILAGGALGLAVAFARWKLWPPAELSAGTSRPDPGTDQAGLPTGPADRT